MVDPVSAAGVAVEVVKWTNDRGWLRKGLDHVRPKHHVLVLGISGVGKTNFLDSLGSPAPRVISRWSRTQYAERRRLHMSGRAKPFVFYDTPGQSQHVAERTRQILDLTSRRGGFGVINVVAYGYVETGTVPTAEAVRGRKADAAYLERQRQIEIAAVDEWISAVALKSDFMMTLVSKADLWFHQRDAVRTYYETGPYADVLSRAGIASHVVTEYASVIHKFYGSAPVSGEFDTNDLLDLRQEFAHHLVAAVTR